jgi:hypothetical protein
MDGGEIEIGRAGASEISAVLPAYISLQAAIVFTPSRAIAVRATDPGDDALRKSAGSSGVLKLLKPVATIARDVVLRPGLAAKTNRRRLAPIAAATQRQLFEICANHGVDCHSGQKRAVALDL